MAEIYKAKIFGAAGFEKLMVVKQILPQYAQDPDFVKMFIDEAKIAVSLSHGNIVPIYELGKIEGVYFIAMEYIDGKNLGEILEHAQEMERQMPTELALFISMEICKGLDYAHRKTSPDGQLLHIIHRDISPQNILVSYDGEVKIVDFGIAKAIYSSQTTKAGVIKGKFGYMSPEQARGLPLDSRTDVFSAGILLFEMLTSSRLFSSDSEVETLENVKMAKVPSPSRLNSSIPPMLDKIIFKALAKDPDDRYQSADDFRKALAKFIYSQGWEVSQNGLARYMNDSFPAETRSREEPSRKSSGETIITIENERREMLTARLTTEEGGAEEPSMEDHEDREATTPPHEDPLRGGAEEPARAAQLPHAAAAAAPKESPGARKKAIMGPPELEALLESGSEDDEYEELPPATVPASAASSASATEALQTADTEAPHRALPPEAKPKARPRTSPGFELAKEVPDREPESVLAAADEMELGAAELMVREQRPVGTSAVPEALEEPPPKRSFAVPVLVITIVVLLGVIGLLLAKFAPTLSPSEKKRLAQEEEKRLIEKRDKESPVYGRVEFFVEPVPVDFYWNGQKHPNSPTKHVQISDLDIKETYRVRLVAAKTPPDPTAKKPPVDQSLMWYPKEYTITGKDWKVIEGLNIFREQVTLDPTPENKEAMKAIEEEKKEKAALEKKRKKRKLN
jgi:serine/threonine protein kinase